MDDETPKIKKPVGKPPLVIDDAFIQKCYLNARAGMTLKQIALSHGINPSTLGDKKRNYPRLEAEIKRGMAEAVRAVEAALFKKCVNEKSDTTAQIFFLKCRGEWRDKQPDITVINESDKAIPAGLDYKEWYTMGPEDKIIYLATGKLPGGLEKGG